MIRSADGTGEIYDDEIKCPIRQILGIMGGRWTLDVVVTLVDGPRHFADLDRAIPRITRRMLSLTLRALQRDGLVSRHVPKKAGDMVHYELTALGKDLAQYFEALTEWSRQKSVEIYSARDRFDTKARRPM